MARPEPFVDIHCHLVPGIDDGAKSWDETLEMARMAVADGIRTIIVTPHQLGSFSHNHGELIRHRTAELQAFLDEQQVPLKVLPGADVRIEAEMVSLLQQGAVLSLGDLRKHVLLELPHELYFPLDGLLERLQRVGMVGILSHPERNEGILADPSVLEPLVARGCLMQVTAGSLVGGMGAGPKELAEWMFERELVHFVATDAHGPKSRRPLMRRAFDRVVELTDEETALAVCCRNPAAVAAGKTVTVGKRRGKAKASTGWFGWRKTG